MYKINPSKFIKILVYFIAIYAEVSCVTKPDQIQIPRAEKVDHYLTKHYHQRNDPYYWMKDRDNPKVIDYLKKENAYTNSVLAPYEGLKNRVFEEMKSKLIEDESTYPVKKDRYYYYSRYIPNQQYPIYARKKSSLENEEEILIDVNKEAAGSTFYESSGPIMTNNHMFMAYAYDKVGRRFYTIEVKNLKTGEVLPFKIENVTPNIVWAADNKTFFYTQQNPETLRADRIFRFNIETQKKDEVYFEKDPTFSVGLYTSLAEDYIFIASSSTLSSEIRYVKSEKPNDHFQVFLPREKDHEYYVVDGKDRFFIKTNYQAKNYRLVECPLNKTDKTFWKDVIPHNKDIYFESAEVFDKFIAVEEKKEGLTQIRILDRAHLKSFEIPFLDETYSVHLTGNAEYKSEILRYEYESPRQPEMTIDINMKTHKSETKKVRAIPNFDSKIYRTERVWAKAKDGRKIPISLLMRKDYPKNAKAPVLMYAYGSYGSSMTPWYSSGIFSLIDRGFIYALVHVRGGAELGRYWYDEGRTINKKNTFTDFIEATEYLIKNKYADSQRIYAMGGSAGGLLMGAIANMRPDLYNGIVAQVPFVDVLTTMLDDSIPLTTSEYDEWGNPNEKKYYDYILSYSPYDNVEKKAYPNILATSGLHDSQVQYWEPTKWVAKIRDYKTNPSLVLLKTEMEAGHSGVSGRYKRLMERAEEFTFLLMLDEKFSKKN